MITPLDKLEKLARDLEKANSIVGGALAKELARVDAAVQQTGVIYRPKHQAETAWELFEAHSTSKALPHPHRFALEPVRVGSKLEYAEYALCAARIANKRPVCVLVSICTCPRSSTATCDYRNTLCVPEDIPLPLRVKIQDVLEDFVVAYTLHIERQRGSLLTAAFGTAPPTDVRGSAGRTEMP